MQVRAANHDTMKNESIKNPHPVRIVYKHIIQLVAENLPSFLLHLPGEYYPQFLLPQFYPGFIIPLTSIQPWFHAKCNITH